MRRLSLPIVLIVAGLAAGCPAAGLPSWEMAKMAGIEKAGWGPPAKVDGNACRAALAGKLARLTVPTWWGKARRPAEGTVYLLEVRYKDTAAKPAVFYAHAGVGGYNGPSEVHRFGGLGDGKWKTAAVPLSWDLIMRRIGPDDVTELLVRADKDLPVASIAVASACREGSAVWRVAAQQYDRQTRHWVGRAQADKRKTANAGKKQTPVLPAAWKDKRVVPFARTYMSEIYPNSAPQKGEAGAMLKLRMARNEYETAAFGIYVNPDGKGKVDLLGAKLRLEGLTGPTGKLACEVDLRAAEYAVVGAGSGKYRLFPQRLWPNYPVNIPAGRSHLFWLTVKTLGPASKPGTYTGKIWCRAGGGNLATGAVHSALYQAAVPVEVEVVDVMLPTMQQAGLDLGACIAPMVPLQDLKTLAEFNHTGMHVWFGGTQPKMKVTDGKLQLDWYYLDDWMGYAAGKLGMTHIFWFMGGDPYGFPDTLNLERDLYRALVGDVHRGRRTFLKKTNAKPDKVLPELRPLIVDFVRQLGEHGKQAGWPAKLVLHPFDEPAKWVQSHKWDNPYHPVIGAGKWINPHFKDSCALFREGGKGHDNILIGGDIHHAKPGLVFVKDIDVFCTNAIHEDQKLGEKVRAAGTEFWQYSGCNDQAPAHRGRFTFGWYFAAYDSVGSLIWAYNTLGRFDTSGGRGWGFGWYTPFGTVQTPFMIGVREGWDDRRWTALLKKRDPAGAKKLLAPIFKDAIARRSRRGRDTVSDFYAEIQSYERMDRWRSQVVDAVLKAGGK